MIFIWNNIIIIKHKFNNYLNLNLILNLKLNKYIDVKNVIKNLKVRIYINNIIKYFIALM